MTQHQDAVRRANIAESCRLVDEALDGMQNSVAAQDVVVGEIAALVKKVFKVAEDAQSEARDARAETATVRRKLEQLKIEMEKRLQGIINQHAEFKEMGFFKRMSWVFRGPV